MTEEIKEVKVPTYRGKRYWIKSFNGVKTVKMDTYGETLLPGRLPTHSKDNRPNSSLIPFLEKLIYLHRNYSTN